MTPLERAARALCTLDGKEPDVGEPFDVEAQPFGGPASSEPSWLSYRDAARAVLQAIREPSDAMLDAGDIWTNEQCSPDAIWQAMIDAALEEG